MQVQNIEVHQVLTTKAGKVLVGKLVLVWKTKVGIHLDTDAKFPLCM
jgi:hypothetical protein